MGKYQLIYFNIRGRAQPIRYLCLDNGIDYEEVTVAEDWDTWLTKAKGKTLFGQVPVLKDGDVEIAEVTAILRYLARKHGLHPSDLLETTRADMIVDHAEDIRLGYYNNFIYSNYETGREDYLKGLSEKLQPLENVLKAWGNDFTNSKICFADYDLFDVLDMQMVITPNALDAYPTLKAYYERIGERPQIKKHRATELFKKRTVNWNGKQ